MKKLITIITALFALVVGAISISAQPVRNSRGKYKPVTTAKAPAFKTKKGKGYVNPVLYNGYYNRRGVYIYETTRVVFKWNGKYRNTYRHKVFPNGRHKVKLIKSVKIRHVYPVSVRYKTETQYFAGQRYTVTYKITRFSNGQRQKIVHHRHRAW